MGNWMKSVLEDGIYPAPLFRRRLREEVARARRSQGMVALAFFPQDGSDITRTIRENVRPMDVVGHWKTHSAVLITEIPTADGQKAWPDRLCQIFHTMLRLATAKTGPDRPLPIGACVLPEARHGKIACEILLDGAEKALKVATRECQPVIYRGTQRFVEVDVPKASPSVTRIGNLYIDRDHMKVVIDSKTTPLRRKEFDLLSYLLKNAGKIVSRENIFRAVWDSEYLNSTRTIDLHIAQIRRIIQPVQCLRIDTVKGVGYRLERLD